jgi:GntR family transcriptional regulator, transcriptional repressor for pyruvate dehydrogenase complex
MEIQTEIQMMEIQTEFTRVPRTSLSDHIIEQMTDLISRGALKTGERIPSEKDLCQQFGVGRTSVREALRSLSAMGILETRVGEGTFVAKDGGRAMERSFHWGLLMNPKTVEDLVETRLMLESQTAFLAAARAKPEDLDHAQEAIRKMEASLADPQQYLEHDLQFHMIIARATQNSILQHLLNTTRGYLQAWIAKTLSGVSGDISAKRARLSITQHKRVVRALRTKDSDGARQAMMEHILSSSADLKKHLSVRSNA